ncbi:MAG: hypothetical protein IPM26_11020 [Saprospiraceae bacterium]|nr:hypothetical protein [Saprospiraceae bacterium]
MVKAIPVLDDGFRKAIIGIAKYGIISPVLIGILIQLLKLPWYVLIVVVPVFLFITFMEMKTHRKIKAGMKEGRLVLDKDSIRLLDGKGNELEKVEITPDTEVEVSGFHVGVIPQKPLFQKNKKNLPFNTIKLKNANYSGREYTFLLETDYMLVQLKNLLTHWKARGLIVYENQ